MKLVCENGNYTLYKEREVIGTAAVRGGVFAALEIAPAWRGRGYGSYLVKEILRSGGGFDTKTASLFTAPLPDSEAGRALAHKFGFVPMGGQAGAAACAGSFCGAALPRFFASAAGAGRAVHRCHLRKRP